MSGPNVSIVIPTFNRGRRLVRAVRSALAQRHADLEVIVVDDASEIGASRTLDALRGDARLRVLRTEQNLGQATARNRGISDARGQWVAFLDDDDEWLPNHVGSLLRRAERTPSAGVLYRPYLVGIGNRVALHRIRLPEGDVFADLARGWAPAITSGSMVRSDVVDAGFDPSLVGIEDYDFWLALAERTSFAVDERPLVIVDKTPGTDRSTMRSRSREAAIVRLRDKWAETMAAKGLAAEFHRTCTQLALTARLSTGEPGGSRTHTIIQTLQTESIPPRTRMAGLMRVALGPTATAFVQRGWFALCGTQRHHVVS